MRIAVVINFASLLASPCCAALKHSGKLDVQVQASSSRAQIPNGCSAEVSANTRTVLLSMVQAGHSSTALVQLFMSSPQVSTLCAYKWIGQCEGFQVVGGLRHMKGKPVRTDLIDIFSEFWDLKRPILLDKLFPDEEEYTNAVRASLVQANQEMPSALASVGVTKLKPAYVIMWTPFCVRHLYKRTFTSRYWTDDDAEAEVVSLQKLKDEHAELLNNNLPVVVISFADLLWKSDKALTKLERFLPCAGKLDASYEPSEKGSKFHVSGSIKAYGSANNPQDCCGFDLESATCNPNDSLFAQLGKWTDQMHALQSYFHQHSQ